MSRRATSYERLTVVCDLDGTLVDTAPDLCGALNSVLTESGLPAVPFDDARLLVGQGARAMVQRGIERMADSRQFDLERLVARFLEEYRARLTRESLPYPGVRQALDEIAKMGHGLAVCTNKPEDLARQMLAELGFAWFGDAVVGVGTFEFRKPDRRTLEGAVAKAGGTIGRAVMVGDSRTDVETARNAGVRVVLVSYGYRGEPVEALDADFTVDDFAAVAGVVKQVATSLAQGRTPV